MTEEMDEEYFIWICKKCKKQLSAEMMTTGIRTYRKAEIVGRNTNRN
jgi:hypothetical protein